MNSCIGFKMAFRTDIRPVDLSLQRPSFRDLQNRRKPFVPRSDTLQKTHYGSRQGEEKKEVIESSIYISALNCTPRRQTASRTRIQEVGSLKRSTLRLQPRKPAEDDRSLTSAWEQRNARYKTIKSCLVKFKEDDKKTMPKQKKELRWKIPLKVKKDVQPKKAMAEEKKAPRWKSLRQPDDDLSSLIIRGTAVPLKENPKKATRSSIKKKTLYL